MVNQLHALPQTGYIRLKSIIGDRKAGIPAVIPVSPATWWRGVRSGIYPQPTRAFGPHITAWPVESIRELIERSMPAAANDDTAGTPTPNASRREGGR